MAATVQRSQSLETVPLQLNRQALRAAKQPCSVLLNTRRERRVSAKLLTNCSAYIVVGSEIRLSLTCVQARPPSIFRRTTPSGGPFSRRNICQLPERLRRTAAATHEQDADDDRCIEPDFTRFQCGATPLPPRTQLPGESI